MPQLQSLMHRAISTPRVTTRNFTARPELTSIVGSRHPLPATLRERLERTLHIEQTVGGRVESSCVGCLNLLCIPVRTQGSPANQSRLGSLARVCTMLLAAASIKNRSRQLSGQQSFLSMPVRGWRAPRASAFSEARPLAAALLCAASRMCATSKRVARNMMISIAAHWAVVTLGSSWGHVARSAVQTPACAGLRAQSLPELCTAARLSCR